MTQPLHYRSATWEQVPAWRRAWPLVHQEATLLFRTRWGLALFFVCLLPTLVRYVLLLILCGVVNFGPVELRRNLGRAREFDLDPARVDFYVNPVLAVAPGMVFVLLLSTLVAARAIARDRATNALELYWTRGITPSDYLVAKWLGSAAAVGVITIASPLFLWINACLLAEDWSLFTTTWLPMLRALAGLTLVTGVWTLLAVLLSASCASTTAAMVLWGMLLVGSSSIGVIAAETTNVEWLRSCLSVWDAGGVVVRAIADVPQRQAWAPGAVLMLTALMLLLWLRARRFLRVSEALQ